MRISDWSSDVCSSDLLYVRRTDHLDDVSRPSRKDWRRTDDAQADTDRGSGDAADNGPDPEDTLQWRRIAGLGMTELCPLGVASTPTPAIAELGTEEMQDILWTRQGRLLFGVELKIVDEEGASLPWDGL